MKVIGGDVQGVQPGEVDGEIGRDDLEEVLELRQALQAEPAHITQSHAIGQAVCQSLGRLGRQQHLAAVASAHHPRHAVQRRAKVVTVACLGLAAVQPHAHPNLKAVQGRPQVALDGEGGIETGDRRREGRAEGVADGLEDLPAG